MKNIYIASLAFLLSANIASAMQNSLKLLEREIPKRVLKALNSSTQFNYSDKKEGKSMFYDPKNDIAFKKVFLNHDDLTVHFLNAALQLKGDKAIKNVSFLPQERLPDIAESKRSILDVFCKDKRGFEYIIEVQNKKLQNFIKRAQFYVANAYSNQLSKGDDYKSLRPVTLLSILTGNVFESNVSYLSHHQIIEKETQYAYLNDLNFTFIELPKFEKKEGELQTPEDFWIYTLKHASDFRTMPKGFPKEVTKALEILEEHSWSQEERQSYIRAKMSLLDDKDADRTAHQKGKEEGRKEGKEEGKEEILRQLLKEKTITQAQFDEKVKNFKK